MSEAEISDGKPAKPAILPEIRDLVATVVAEVQRRKGQLPMTQSSYIRYSVADDFAYGELGVVANRGLRGERIVKPSWDLAGSIITRDTQSSLQFEAAKNALVGKSGDPGAIDTILSNFVMRLAAKLAADEIQDAEQATADIDSLLYSIAPGPKEHRAKVELLGLILRCPQIELPGLTIRQTRREDLEKDVLDFPRNREVVGSPYPSAIAELSVVCAESTLHNEVIPKLIAMLRLLVVASIKYSGYRVFSRLWGSDGATPWYPGDHTVPPVRSYVAEKDALRMNAFWRQMGQSVPKHLYQPNPSLVDYISIAYERYCAGLLRTDIFEERVANAVMGLEALFLKEKQEVMYRCSLRAARAMSYLGEDAKQVFGLLHDDAYAARNAFAHGDRLSPKKKKKIEAKYGGDSEIVYRSVMNYLRKGLIAAIVGTAKKSAVISSLDESLLDPTSDAPVAAFFASAASIVG
jgi:hypothetical protein